MTERVPQLFLGALADLAHWLEAARAPAMVVGGIAASILGRPRATRDIDTQDLRDIEGLLDVFPKADIESVRRFIRAFANAAEIPTLPDELERLLAQRKSRSKRARDTKR